MYESNDHFKYTQCVNTYTYSLTKINCTYLFGSYLDVTRDFIVMHEKMLHTSGVFLKTQLSVNVFVWWGGGLQLLNILKKVKIHLLQPIS